MTAKARPKPAQKRVVLAPRTSAWRGGGGMVLSDKICLLIDLETVTDPRFIDLEKTKDGKDRFPPPPAHQVVCAGYAWIKNWRVESWGVLDENEETMLRKLCASIRLADPRILTMNGRHFDLPVMVARCLGHGIPFPWYYATKNPRYRYSQECHMDLMDVLCDYGAGPKASMDAWARLCGWPGKEGTDGANVAELMKTGGVAAVGDYCMKDVVQETAIYLRAELLRGVLRIDAYREAASALLDYARADLRTAGLAAKVDVERWMLEGKMSGERVIGEEDAAE